MNTRHIYTGTPAVDEVIRVPVPEAGLLLCDGSSYTATLQHLNKSINSKSTEITDALDADFSDLKPTVSFSSAKNYEQTLGVGNYALKFSAAGASVTITVTS